jgi:hypothetical protein
MSRKEKIAILLIAVMVSLVGFNLMVSPSALDMVRQEKPLAYHMDVTVTAHVGSNAQAVVQFGGLS